MFNRILLVDDSKSARFALRKMLENNGYEVDMAANAEEALGYLDSHQPDVIFMDHFMPGMDGFEAARVIKDKPATAAIPIIMCTSKDDEDYIHQARANGAVDILPKPATPDALNGVLDKLASTVDVMASQEPINAPEFDPGGAVNGSANAQPLFPETVPAEQTAAIPTIDEVVLPAEEVRKIAAESASVELDKVLPGRVTAMLESKVPQLRDAVMANFDTVVKSLLDQYVRDALDRVRDEYSEAASAEASRIAQQVSREVLDTTVASRVQLMREELLRELNEQLSEIYSTVGDLKANQFMKKASPELMKELVSRAEEAATEQANESLLKASEIAQETATKVTEESTEEALKQFYEDFQQQLVKIMESNLEVSRQEADEVTWRKITELQNDMNERIDKLKLVAGAAVFAGVVAIGGMLYLMY